MSASKLCKILLLLALCQFGVAHGNSREAVKPFSLQNTQGEEISLEQLKGKVVLINFWATWCPPCIHELPSMQDLKLLLFDQPFEILAVNVGEDYKQIENFLIYFGLPLDFPILVNDTMSVANAWGVRAMPTSFLLDKAGKKVGTIIGARDWASEETLAMIRPLIDE